MAISKKGILGGMNGKAGNVVGYTMYGKEFLRSLPNRTAPFTPAELRNQVKFGMVQDTLSPIKAFIANGFKGYYTPTGGMRGAQSYNSKLAVVQNGNDFSIDPEKFKVTGGDLPGAEDPQFVMESARVLRFHWDSNTPQGANPNDQVMLLAIDLPNQKASFCNIGAFRNTGTEILNLSSELLGKELDIYIGFVAKDRSRQSDSQYLGKIIA